MYKFIYVHCIRKIGISDEMNDMSISCHFLRALFRLLSEFLTVQTARGAQERKHPEEMGKKKKREKKRCMGKGERR